MTYAQLQLDIADWILNDDIPVQTLIRLCEAEINRTLRLTQQQTEIPFTINARTVAMPSDLAEIESFTLDEIDSILQYLTALELKRTQSYPSQGKPAAYTIIGSNFEFAPEPTVDNAATLVYYTKFPALSETNQTHWLLENAYDLYLYGSLLHAPPGAESTQSNLPKWIQGYQRAIDSVRKWDSRLKHRGNENKRIPGFSP